MLSTLPSSSHQQIEVDHRHFLQTCSHFLVEESTFWQFLLQKKLETLVTRQVGFAAFAGFNANLENGFFNPFDT